MLIATDGIVLKEVKIKESDRILTILTRDKGLVTASAKSSLRMKNKLASATGLLSWSDFVLFQGRTMYSVNEAESKNVFFDLRNDIETLSTALYLAELTSVFTTDANSSEELLELLLFAFDKLCKAKQPAAFIKTVYELKLLSVVGYMPNLLACADCLKFEDKVFYYDIPNGELFCSECAGKRGFQPNVTLATIAAMRHIVFSETNKMYSFTLGKENFENLSNIVNAYTQYHLDKPLKTHQFLTQLQNDI